MTAGLCRNVEQWHTFYKEIAIVFAAAVQHGKCLTPVL